MNNFPDDVLEHIFSFISSDEDRNGLSTVCKKWHNLDRQSRRPVFVGNCYAISPERVVARFTGLRALTLKGKPQSADHGLVPHDWGGFLDPWIRVLAKSCPGFEELRLKRMVVSDESLKLLAISFPNFKSLVLVRCEGLTSYGLGTVVWNCRHLRELDLPKTTVDDYCGLWLSCFPEGTTSLEFLNFSEVECMVNCAALECLVARSPNLRTLRVNVFVPFETLARIVEKAPQLVDLGTGLLLRCPNFPSSIKFREDVSKCHSIRSLPGIWHVNMDIVVAVSDLYPLCSNLTSLDLSCTFGFHGHRVARMISHCRKLRHLWILNSIEDKGLLVVADSCKDLEELQVFPADHINPQNAENGEVTEVGLVTISYGCPRLNSIFYHCREMTNAALIAVAKNCPNLTRFRLDMFEVGCADPVTLKPLDEGVGAIVQSCKKLARLYISGLFLTDQCFLFIGMYGQQLKTLSFACAGESDEAMRYVLNGCKKLRKLEIWECPFGDAALLGVMGKYETMRSVWMSSCEVTLGGCRRLAKEMPQLNVEIIKESQEVGDGNEVGVEIFPCQDEDDEMKVDKLYFYRTLEGPRKDAPEVVRYL